MRERKSIGMKNFIFKSSPIRDSDLQKFSLQLRLIQSELRHQRDDNSDIKRRLTRIISILTHTSPVLRQDELPVEEEELEPDNSNLQGSE